MMVTMICSAGLMLPIWTRTRPGAALTNPRVAPAPKITHSDGSSSTNSTGWEMNDPSLRTTRVNSSILPANTGSGCSSSATTSRASGCTVGSDRCTLVGENTGLGLGVIVGVIVGVTVGISVGATVGNAGGTTPGVAVATSSTRDTVGVAVGRRLGVAVGVRRVGEGEGVGVEVRVGALVAVAIGDGRVVTTGPG